MSTRYAIVLGCFAISALPVLMAGCGGDSPTGSSNNLTVNEPVRPTIPPGYSSKTIHVKFREGANVDLPLEAPPPALRNGVKTATASRTLVTRRLPRGLSFADATSGCSRLCQGNNS